VVWVKRISQTGIQILYFDHLDDFDRLHGGRSNLFTKKFDKNFKAGMMREYLFVFHV